MNQKHPIDDLFRSKLVDYNIPVRQDLKQVFLDKTKAKKNRIIPFWIFALAASFIAVLSFFWLAQKEIAPNATQTLSTNENPKQTLEPIVSADQVEVKVETSGNQIEPSEIKIIKKTSPLTTTKVSKILIPNTNELKAVQFKSATGLEIMDEVIPDELTLALMESQKPKESSNSRTNKNQKELFKKDVGETMIIIASEFQKVEEILIPEISSDSPLTILEATAIANARNEENNSLLAKVFSNIKHLKHGEKVDLSLTTQVDYSEDTFIGNETREIKEKIDWIKARIAKR